MKTKLTTLLILLTCVSLYAQKDWETLTQDNYTIDYPKDWVSSDKKPQPTMQFLLLSDEASQKEDLFRENINLTTEDLGGKVISIDDYSKFSTDQITSQIPSAKIVSDTSIKVNGWGAKAVIWSADFGNGMILKFKQIYLINNGIAYVLTFSSTTAEYDAYIEVADKILNSFKLVQ